MYKKVICVITTLSLAFIFLAAGYLVCLIPQATQALSTITNKNEISVFSKSELTQTALAIREYSFGNHDQVELMGVVQEINRNENTPYASVSIAELKNAPDTYTLDTATLQHLDDVHKIASDSYVWIGLFAFLALAGLIATGFLVGKKAVGRELFWSAFLLVIAQIGLAVWAIVDFDTFFAGFHKLFFEGSTWLFSSESLIICALPTPFWIGMVIIWVLVSVLLCVISMIIGRKLIK